MAIGINPHKDLLQKILDDLHRDDTRVGVRLISATRKQAALAFVITDHSGEVLLELTPVTLAAGEVAVSPLRPVLT